MNDWIFGIFGKHMRLDLCLKEGEKTNKPVHGESTPTPTQTTNPQTGIMYQRWKLTVPYKIEPLPSNSGDQFTWSDCASSLTNPATGHHTTFTPSPQAWTRISVRILSLSQASFSFYGFHGGPAKTFFFPKAHTLQLPDFEWCQFCGWLQQVIAELFQLFLQLWVQFPATSAKELAARCTVQWTNIHTLM